MNAKIRKAIAWVEELLLKQWLEQLGDSVDQSKNYSVEIVPWGKGPWGFRVAEVSFMSKPKSGALSGTSGSSFMRMDDIRVPAIVEALVIEKVYFGEDLDVWIDLLLTGTVK